MDYSTNVSTQLSTAKCGYGMLASKENPFESLPASQTIRPGHAPHTPKQKPCAGENRGYHPAESWKKHDGQWWSTNTPHKSWWWSWWWRWSTMVDNRWIPVSAYFLSPTNRNDWSTVMVAQPWGDQKLLDTWHCTGLHQKTCSGGDNAKTSTDNDDIWWLVGSLNSLFLMFLKLWDGWCWLVH